MIKIAKNCILLHGAWHGAWAWKKVIPELQKFSFKNIIAPDLPGHGINKYENYKNITLNKYVDFVTKLINAHPEQVILVGHSMSGVIISQVAENIPGKIHKLIYVAGFIPSNNGCLLDEEKSSKNPSVALEVKIDEKNYAITLENPKKIQELFYHKCTQIDREYALEHFQKQPLLPFTDKISISHERFGKVAKMYIECLQDKAINIEDQRRMYSKINCDIQTLDTDHSPFLSAVEGLTNIIGSTLHEVE